VVGAMIAATMSQDGTADLLGFDSENANGLAVVHIDTEQSEDDHWDCVSRALKRAGRKEPPPWLHSYWFAGLGAKEAWEMAKQAISLAAKENGGIHSVVLDGVADFVSSPNDEAECNAFVAELHNMAIEHKCSIIVVIHFNPNGEKTRGHLGSQLERKCETNLRLDKKTAKKKKRQDEDEDEEAEEVTANAAEIIEIWSDKQRRAPIPKGSGPCFAWSDEAGMHVSVPNPSKKSAAAKADLKLADMRTDAARVFSAEGEGPFRRCDLLEAMQGTFEITEAGAIKKLKLWLEKGVVSKDEISGLYAPVKL
jgi:hypothetical protein